MGNENLNITYFLGAGASAEALPLIKADSDEKTMHFRLKSLSKKLDSILESYDNKYQSYVSNLKDNLIWLAEKTEEFTTPDTYAKFLYLKDRKSLKRLKNTLSAYFIFEQLFKKSFDKRALIFLTTILKNPFKFPENINILTWNYDFQMQLAAEYFRKESLSVGDRGNYSRSPPLIEYSPQLGTLPIMGESISMVHLNGIAGFYSSNQSGSKMTRSVFERSYEIDVNTILSELSSNNFDNRNLLWFAWEQGSSENVKNAIEIAETTDVLVIIGYSFPFFNREIDMQIFSALKKSGRFQKIYFQDPFNDGAFLKNQFELSDDIEIKNMKSAGNYFIPPEL